MEKFYDIPNMSSSGLTRRSVKDLFCTDSLTEFASQTSQVKPGNDSIEAIYCINLVKASLSFLKEVSFGFIATTWRR